MSVAFTFFQPFKANVNNGIFNFATDQLMVALTNSAPSLSNNKLSDITEISYTSCSSRVITTTSSTQTSGTYSLILQDLVLTSSGTVGPFRYVVFYDNTVTNKNLIGYYDIGSNVTLNASDTETIDLDNINGLFQLT